MKSEMMGQPVEVTTTYSDYKKTDFGIAIPFTKNVDAGMFQVTQKISKVEVNKEIDAKAKDPDTKIREAVTSIMKSFPPGAAKK